MALFNRNKLWKEERSRLELLICEGTEVHGPRSVSILTGDLRPSDDPM